MTIYTGAIELRTSADGSAPTRTGAAASRTVDPASRPARTGAAATLTRDAASRPDRVGEVQPRPTTWATRPRRAPAPAAGRSLTASVKVPDGYNGVAVVVRDATTEERLPEVSYLTTPGLLGIISAIDDQAEGTLYLRTTDYTEFLAVAERDDGKATDYTWYSAVDRQDPINPVRDDEATVWVERAELRGMWAGTGFDRGGQLG